MVESLKNFGCRMLDRREQSSGLKLARAAALIAEPFYSTAMAVRNRCYDRGIFRTQQLGMPTISVGNITTGGTGKTPVVHWLATQLRNLGGHPAILLRGYGDSLISDEADMLDQSLNSEGKTKIPVKANPSRIIGAAEVLKHHPDVDAFILDDGFQHRKVQRNFNLVLISATQPFGFGHVLPRGLLRESLKGLKRADAFLITRCSLVEPVELQYLDDQLTAKHPKTPIFHCDHQLSEIGLPLTHDKVQIESLKGQRVLLVAGIGDPAAFAKQLANLGCIIVNTKWFADHHSYTNNELGDIFQDAAMLAANMVLTTEKDWSKMKLCFPAESQIPIGIVKVKIKFAGEDREILFHHILQSL